MSSDVYIFYHIQDLSVPYFLQGSALQFLSPTEVCNSVYVFRRQEKTIMKLVVDAETDRVLGASMCGPDAPEIIQVKHMYNSLVIFSVFRSSSHSSLLSYD